MAGDLPQLQQNVKYLNRDVLRVDGLEQGILRRLARQLPVAEDETNSVAAERANLRAAFDSVIQRLSSVLGEPRFPASLGGVKGPAWAARARAAHAVPILRPQPPGLALCRVLCRDGAVRRPAAGRRHFCQQDW